MLRHGSFSPILLQAAAVTLAAVGIGMNGWYGRSLGSSEAAGWLFLAVGVASDLVALVMPSWRRLSLAGPTGHVAGRVDDLGRHLCLRREIGLASTNIADVTLARASRVTPAVTAAPGRIE